MRSIKDIETALQTHCHPNGPEPPTDDEVVHIFQHYEKIIRLTNQTPGFELAFQGAVNAQLTWKNIAHARNLKITQPPIAYAIEMNDHKDVFIQPIYSKDRLEFYNTTYGKQVPPQSLNNQCCLNAYGIPNATILET